MYKINYSYLNQKAGAEPNIEGKILLIQNLEKKKNEIFNEVQNKEFKFVGEYFKFPFFVDTEFLKIVIEFYKYIYKNAYYRIKAVEIFAIDLRNRELFIENDNELSNIYSFYKFDQISAVTKETINKDKQLFSNNNNQKKINLNNILNNLENNVNDDPEDFLYHTNPLYIFTRFYSLYKKYRTITIYKILVLDFTILKFYKNIFIDEKTLKEKTFKIFQDFSNFNSILDYEQELEISLEFINSLIDSRNKLFNDYHENFFTPEDNFLQTQTNLIISLYDRVISDFKKILTEQKTYSLRNSLNNQIIEDYEKEKEDLIKIVEDAKEKYKNLQTSN
jgi:hypothetical protein